MKKFLVGLLISIVLILAVVLVFLRTSSSYRSIYLVPQNAVLIVETKDPFVAWDKIIHSKAWNHLRTNNLLKEINNEIVSVDSLVSSNKFLLKLIGKKSVLVSQHPMGNDKYEFLYIVDVGKIANLQKPEKIFNSVLGENYEITSRNYKERKVVEIINVKEGGYYFLSFVQGKLIFSLDPKLIEASIDASEKMIIGRERKFLDVYSKLGNSGLFSIFINHKNLGPLVGTLSQSTKKNTLVAIQHFQFSGISFNITEEGLISLEAYTSLSDTFPELSKELFYDGDLELASADVIPQRLASLVKINFKDASEYFHASMSSLGKESYDAYVENIAQIDKKFKISVEDNLFAWMDKELVLIQTQPSNLGRSNEFAVIMHAADSADAAENLQFLWRQIKKNSPIKVKMVNYKNYNIDYIAFPGILKMLFGKALSKIEKPYFTQIGKNVIVSNHPQTLKNLIDDYLAQSTIGSSIDYYNFNKHFGNKTALFAYFEPPVLYYNLRESLSPESWRNLQKNKTYFTCFNQAGLQLELNDDLIHFNLKAQYLPESANWEKQYYNSGEIFALFNTSEATPKPTVEVKKDTIPEIIIQEFDTHEQKEYYANGDLKREVELKDGLKHGSFKEYYENGELKIKGNFEKDQPIGKWKYYDEEGELIKTDKY